MTTTELFGDITDSRDVIKRIEELREERSGIAEDGENEDEIADALREWDEENGEELAALEAFAEEASGYAPDWEHGETIIADSYFEEYARELADDIGAVDRNQSWPGCHIDWAAAADALKADYTSINYNGREYWIR